MAYTTFVDSATVVEAEWLNETNTIVHDIMDNATNKTEARTALNLEDGSTADQTATEIKALYESDGTTYTTLANLQAAAGDVTIGVLYYIKERSTGNGGGAWWEAIAKITENDIDIATGSATVSFQLVFNGEYIYANQLGAVGDGSDETAILTRAKVLGELYYRNVWLEQTVDGYVITAGMSIDIYKTVFRGNGALVKFVPAGSDTLFNITNSFAATDPNQAGLYAAANKFTGVYFKGPGKSVSNVRFADIDDATAVNSIWAVTFSDGGIYGFAEGVYQGDGAFMINYINFHFLNNGWCQNVAVATGSGERTDSIGCNFANNDQILIQSKGATTFYNDCSLDYSPRMMTITGGDVFINGGHIENSYDTDYWFHVSGDNSTLSICNNVLVISPSSDKIFEPIYCDSGCIMGGVILDNIELWTNSNTSPALIGGTGAASAEKLRYFLNSSKTPVGDVVNLTSYGDFEIADWVNDFTLEGGVTPVRDTGESNSGVASVRLEQTSVDATAKVIYDTDIGVNGFIVGKFAYKTTLAGTGGTFSVSVKFLDKADATIASGPIIPGETGDIVWTDKEMNLQIRAPKGAVTARIEFSLFGTTSGTAYAWIDDLIINKV